MTYRVSRYVLILPAGIVNTLIRILCMVACVFIFPVASSSDNWRIVNYNLEHGLSQISVNSIIQDSYGFLWIGTQDGLNKFNGYEFIVYRHQPADPSSLSHSLVRSVMEDDRGNIWISTPDGLNVFDRRENIFHRYRYDPRNPASISSNDIFYVYQDQGGIIWIKSGEGLDRYDPETGIFRHIPHYNNPANNVSGTDNFIITEDSRGRLWIGSKDGMFLFDRESEEFTGFFYDPSDNSSLSNNRVRAIYEAGDGRIYVGTGSGVNIFDPETGTFSGFVIGEPAGSGSRVNSINTIGEDSRGTLWIGTEGGLFSSLPGENGVSVQKKEVFSDLEIFSILEDRSGNLWLGTIGGLYMMDTRSKFSTYRVHEFQPDAPRAAGFVASISLFDDNELWLGTWGGGLFIINRITGETVHYSSSAKKKEEYIPNDFVHVIHRDSSGRIILGTRDGLYLYRNRTEGFGDFCFSSGHEACGVFNSNRIYTIFEDSGNTIWVGTRHGLHSFSGDSLVSYYHDPFDENSIASSQVNDIIECRDGYLWFATADGLSRFNRESGRFRNFRRDADKGRFSLSNNELTCLYEDSAGNIWIGSVAGLNRFFRSTGSFIVFSELEGLPNNLIYSILEDNNGHLWITTNYGLARFDPATLDISTYDVADGLQSYEFNLGARYKSKEGELFFGGIAGVNAFFPASIGINETIPPVAITSFEIFSGEGIRISDVGTREEIVLRHNENSFSIEFAVLDYTRPGRNRYAYMMEGLDNNWIHTGTRRMAGYSRVPPGTYTFRVRGSNNDDVWNEEGASLRIIVTAPWWHTGYAYTGYSAFTVLLVFLLGFYSTRRLRNAHHVLKEKEMASAEISRQKEELSLKNKNITDSLNYARRIQIAMMPRSRQFSMHLPDSFIYFKPKDIVSGDFYWINKINDKIFFAVIDCTGHGVPGAFMSIIGYELLRNIINVKKIEKPSDILNTLNKDFSAIFAQRDEEEFSFRDGMDIGFCVIDKKKGLLEFAGAFTPLYMVRNNKILEIKGNRFSVGLMDDLIHEEFRNHTLKLKKDDMLYLFTDGYPDQFGGEDGKKFKYRRFRHLLLTIHGLSADQQMEMLDRRMIQWMGDHEQVDDILVIGIRPGLDFSGTIE